MDLPDCKLCAACCFSPHELYIELKGADHARLTPREQAELTHFVGTRCFMKMKDGHCVALVQEGDEWLCSLYERRPALCRDFERGGPACAADRSLP